MRHSLAILFCLGLFCAAVQGAWIVRGIELLFLYYAYRMDVEISDKLGQKPLLGANMGGMNYPEDYKDGQDQNKKGLNFHGFASAVQSTSSDFSREHSRKMIADPWNPTLKEVKDLARWPKRNGQALAPIDSKGNNIDNQRFSFTGVDVVKYLGGANQGPDRFGKDKKYFDFDNVYAIVGKRVEDLWKLDKGIAEKYMKPMLNCLKESQIGRAIDSAPFKLRSAWKELTDQDTKRHKGQKRLSDKQLVIDSSSEHPNAGATEDKLFATHNKDLDSEDARRDRGWQEIDQSETRKNIRKAVGKDDAKAIMKDLRGFTKKWADGVDANGNSVWTDMSDQNHENLRKQQGKLENAMMTQMGTASPADACAYPNPKPPTNPPTTGGSTKHKREYEFQGAPDFEAVLL